MRAVWFIRKFELVLKCNNYENQTSKSRTSQTRKTLAVSHSDDFTTDHFQEFFLQKISHPDRQFRGNAPTLSLT